VCFWNSTFCPYTQNFLLVNRRLVMRIYPSATVLFTCVVTSEAPCAVYCDVINIGLVAITWKGDICNVGLVAITWKGGIGNVGLVSQMEGGYWQCRVSKRHNIAECSIGFSK
jgi:hypothetical protein